MTHNPTGLLTSATRPFTTNKIDAPSEIAAFVEYFWVVQWDISTEQSFTSLNIPFPCAHLVFETGATGLFGPAKGCFEKKLTGKSFAIGARFKTGYLYPLIKMPMTALISQRLDTAEIISLSSAELESQLVNLNSHAHIIETLTTLIKHSIQNVDERMLEKAKRVYNICRQIEVNQSINQVEQLAQLQNMSVRSLERLFSTYVGLSPKWIIRLFRLQQLANQLIEDTPIDWVDLSLELGYFDQAHCMNDFKAFTGKSASLIRKGKL
jgi:AraC-like DNA-binding protein